MKGPFKPEDFADPGFQGCHGLHIRTDQEIAAALANGLDAKRWACPEGGEHEPDKVDGDSCWKCISAIRPRWEKVRNE